MSRMRSSAARCTSTTAAAAFGMLGDVVVGPGSRSAATRLAASRHTAFACRTYSALVGPLPPPPHAPPRAAPRSHPPSARFMAEPSPPLGPDGSAPGPSDGATGTGTSPYPAEVLIATALWWMTPELVGALDRRLGTPVDSYVNGSQTWFTRRGADARVAAASGRRRSRCRRVCRTTTCGSAWSTSWPPGSNPDALALGQRDPRPLAALWDGLECFPAYGDDLEPATLSRRATELLGIAPGLCGLVDHDKVADAWEATKGAVSIVRLLGDQLQT